MINITKIGICIFILYGFYSIIFNYERKLVQYFKDNDYDVPMSDWMTVLFNFYYLQYKINKEVATPLAKTIETTETPSEWEI